MAALRCPTEVPRAQNAGNRSRLPRVTTLSTFHDSVLHTKLDLTYFCLPTLRSASVTEKYYLIRKIL